MTAWDGTSTAMALDRLDVLHWLNLQPMKLGSIEDYVLRMSTVAAERGLVLAFAFGAGVSVAVRDAFETQGVAAFFVDEIAEPSSLRRLTARLQPWAVHFHFFSQCEQLYITAHSRLRVVTLMSAHLSLDVDEDDGGLLLGFARRVRRRLYATQIDRFLAVSGFVGDALVHSGAVPAAKVHVIYNGVDLKRHRVHSAAERAALKRALFGLDDSHLVITFVGQLEPYKGVQDLFAVIERIAEKVPNVRFVFVGTGSLSGSPMLAHQAVLNLGLRDDVQAIIGASDVFWAPSRWLEAFGLVLAEASAAGVPSITTRVGGIPEVVVDGVNGFLVEPGDVDALADRALRLIGDDALRLRIGQAARAHAEKWFSMERTVAATLDLYEPLRPARRNG